VNPAPRREALKCVKCRTITQHVQLLPAPFPVWQCLVCGTTLPERADEQAGSDEAE
jgi:hypothetical protein